MAEVPWKRGEDLPSHTITRPSRRRKAKTRIIKSHLPGDKLACVRPVPTLLQCRLKLPHITKDSASAAHRKS
jgi:hypothetical protein